jgi:tripartite-type tricarboxylate transporter receptor subunit TctC
LATCLTLITKASGAIEQNYPSRPITIIVPFVAGGPMDVVARILAERMQASLGQPILIENVAGAGGTIGVGRVARAKSDGYTLCYGGWATHVINGAAYKLAYDVLSDFEPVALIASAPWLIVAKKEMPPNDLRGLIGWLKANPGEALVGTAGVGSSSHAFAALFQSATGTRFQFVHYRGSAPAIRDLVAGQIDLMFDSPTTALTQVRAGRIKAYAVTSKYRLASAPEIPTAEEAGLTEFDIQSWHGLWAPRGTQSEIVNTLNKAVGDALADPGLRRTLADLEQDPPPSDLRTPSAFFAFHKGEIEKWWPILKAANIKGE